MTALPASAARPAIHFRGPAYQAYRMMQVGFGILPIVVGLDKFFDKIVYWDGYMAPPFQAILGQFTHPFMMIGGVAEIVTGIGILWRPKIFAYVLSAALLCIVINLLIYGKYLDIALRDVGLSLGALALGRLAMEFDRVTDNLSPRPGAGHLAMSYEPPRAAR